MIPTRHLNGTSQKDGDENHETMLVALREAIKAMEVASPNARDYYLQGPVNRILQVADVR